MENKEVSPNGPASAKRLKISKTQQETLLIALVSAAILGICGVLFIYFVKYINFNNKVIDAKDSAIVDYETTIKNIGVCSDKDRDGKISDEELNKCDPNSLNSSTMKGTLRYNVLVEMANNTDLETVALSSGQSGCYDENKQKINWQKIYDSAKDDKEKNRAVGMLKLCSSLRVIPDALPAQQNDLALMTSLNKIFDISNHSPSSLSPSGNASAGSSGISTIPVSLSVEADAETTLKVLDNIEKSIRTFDLRSAVISWSSQNFLTLRSQGVAYYTENTDLVETRKTVTANSNTKKE